MTQSRKLQDISFSQRENASVLWQPWLSNTFWWTLFSQTVSWYHVQTFSEWVGGEVINTPLTPLSSTEGRRREA